MPLHQFAKNLRHLRQLRGWEQHQLASLLGVDSRTVSVWERGKGWPATHYLILCICDLFHVSADDLIRSDLARMKEIPYVRKRKPLNLNA